MRSGWWLVVFRTGALVAAVSFAALPARAGTLVLQGSTTFQSELVAGHLPAIEAEAGQTLTVIPNKSNLGLIALLKGEADIAMISTALGNETEVLRRTNPTLPIDRLQEHVVGRTRAALVVHPSNPVISVSGEDLRRILAGEIANWRDVGGPDLPIRVVAVREGGGVLGSVEAAVLGSGAHLAATNQIRVQNGPQIVKVVEQEPGALGITQRKLVDGRAVRIVTMARPIEQQLSLVTMGEPSDAMASVMAAFRATAIAAGLE